MLFLIETRYNGGDLEIYFYKAIEQSDSFVFSFNGPFLITSLHGQIFKLFGPSLLGISLFYGFTITLCSDFNYYFLS